MEESPPFQLIGGHVALDFANTLDNRYDPDGSQELLPAYADFLRFCTESGVLRIAQARMLARVEKNKAAAAVEDVHELREVLQRIFSAIATESEINESDVMALNAAIRDASASRALCAEQGGLVWKWIGVEKNPLGPLWLIAYAAVELLTSEEAKRVRECGNRTCRWLFLDTSKNRSRRWCDMKICGNRIKARNYYRRMRQQQQSG